MDLMDKNELEDAWRSLFRRDETTKAIMNIIGYYPEKRSLILSFKDTIDRYNSRLADTLLIKPKYTISIGEGALGEFIKLYDVDFNDKVNIRITDLGNDIMIRNIRATHVGRLVSIKGLVKMVKEVKPRLTRAAFKCKACGALNVVEQTGNYMTLPTKCSGCEAKGSQMFDLVAEHSTFIDSQSIFIEENTEDLRGGEQPQKIEVFLEDDITGDILPGDLVNLVGIVDTSGPNPGKTNIRTRDMYITGLSITVDSEQKYETVNFTEEEVRKIIEQSKDKDLYSKIRNSIAPQIHGMEEIKTALALQLFGGVRKTKPNKLRGDIHILMIGDPGIAKSQLIRRMTEIAPRSRYASGKASTGAGLTASAIKESSADGTSEWSLEAGTLVLADMGIAGIDEIDKMSANDRDAMYEAMEQQTISVSKAGINATLQARCAIISAANPKHGRIYEEDLDNLQTLIDLPVPLVSRFDLIYLMKDSVDTRKDMDLARHIINTHFAGEALQQLERSTDPIVDKTEAEAAAEKVSEAIELDLLRKYISYAKAKIFPVISEEAKVKLVDYYINLRGKANEDTGIPITPRQLEAIIRLSEAYARVRLSNSVDVNDVNNAIEVLRYAYGTLGFQDDYTLTETGRSSKSWQKSRSEEKSMRKMLVDIINDLFRESKTDMIKEYDIFNRIKEEQSDKEEKEIKRILHRAKKELEQMNMKGEILRSERKGRTVYKRGTLSE